MTVVRSLCSFLLFAVCSIKLFISSGSIEVDTSGRNSTSNHGDVHHAKISDLTIFVLSNTDHLGFMHRDR